MEDLRNNESNVDSQINDDIEMLTTVAEDKATVRMGDKSFDVGYKIYDNDEIDLVLPEGISDDDEKKLKEQMAKKAKALINKSNFKRNKELKELRAQLSQKEQLEKKQEPSRKKSESVEFEEFTFKDYGCSTQEELNDMIVDSPEKYQKLTNKLMINRVNLVTNSFDKKIKKTQTETLLRSKATIDDLSYDDYENWAIQNDLKISGKTYKIYSQLQGIKRLSKQKDKDIKISFKKSGTSTKETKTNDYIGNDILCRY